MFLSGAVPLHSGGGRGRMGKEKREEERRMEYEVIRSARKTTALQIKDGKLIVRAPFRASDAQIQRFVENNRRWIETHLEKAAARAKAAENAPKLTPDEIAALAKKAAETIPQRVAFYAAKVGVTYGRITIRKQRSRWGSCSAKGNLNFNCLLMLAPPEVLDGVIVHELCHRKELNHSVRFWTEVARILPDYKQPLKWLKNEGQSIITRINS